MLLALQMGCTLNELSHRMTALEETYWIAYHKDRPFAEERVDVALARIAQILHNTNAKKPKKLLEFLPWHRKRKRSTESDLDEIKSVLQRVK